MFLGSLNLALLSLCYINSNNTITQTTFDFAPSYNQTYGVYTFGFRGDRYNNLLLRYDNQTLMEFETIAQSDYVSFGVSTFQTLNFSCYLTLEDSNISTTGSFDCVDYGGVDDTGFRVFTYSTTSYAPTYTSWQPDIFFSVRLIASSTIATTSPDSYRDGYSAGYYQGNAEGYTNGYTDGYGLGNTEGYTSGFETGSASGYQQGYTDAMSNHDFTFTNLFGSIADTPILMIRRLFGFELFGVGLISVFMSLFTALIVIHLIKKVF